MKKMRQGLVDYVTRFVASENAAPAKRLTAVRVRRMVDAIRETYDEEEGGKLPRSAMDEMRRGSQRHCIHD